MAKREAKWQRGEFSERRDPIWEPLLELLPEDIDDFMWMGEVELTDGTRIQLYKHYWTRRYLMLDLGGRTFVHRDKGRYEEAEDPEGILRAVFDVRPGGDRSAGACRDRALSTTCRARIPRTRSARSAG